MGWTFGWDTKRSLVWDRTQKETGGNGTKWECLKSCYRGNNFSGVLWTVWEITRPGGEKQRFIGCDLLKYSGGDWGYKDLEESSHPYYYSCPLGYLDMVPVACEEWRAKVREYHARRNPKLVAGGHYKLVPGISFLGTPIISIRVKSLRPLRAEYYSSGGVQIGAGRFKKKMVEAPIKE